MTWLVWRQHRLEALAAAAVAAVLAVVVTPTALHLYQVTALLRQGGCLGGSPGASCGTAMDAFNATSHTLQGIVPLLNILPGLAGAFIGAPLLSREYEDGTWRLAWSQGVTRLAWLRGQMLGALAVTALSAALFTAVLTWWLSPVNYVNGRFTNNGFDFTGIVPAAWALLAFAIGVLAGTALRRVVPAMAVTLAGYAVIRFPVEYLLRPRYLPPVEKWGLPFAEGSGIARNDWELGLGPVAPGGHAMLTGAQFDQVEHTAQASINRATASQATYVAELNHWLTAHGYTQVATYQPADRFWTFQGIEAAICLLLALAALAVAYRLVSRRPS